MPAPLGSDPDITFLSGVTSDATVAPISYGTWTKLNQNSSDLRSGPLLLHL